MLSYFSITMLQTLLKYCQATKGVWSRQIFDWTFYSSTLHKLHLHRQERLWWNVPIRPVRAILECSCLWSWSSGEIFRITLTYLIFHLKQTQNFPSMAVIFGAYLISVHSCVHLWARCLGVYNLTMHPRVQFGWNLYTVCWIELKIGNQSQGDPLIVKP